MLFLVNTCIGGLDEHAQSLITKSKLNKNIGQTKPRTMAELLQLLAQEGQLVYQPKFSGHQVS